MILSVAIKPFACNYLLSSAKYELCLNISLADRCREMRKAQLIPISLACNAKLRKTKNNSNDCGWRIAKIEKISLVASSWFSFPSLFASLQQHKVTLAICPLSTKLGAKLRNTLLIAGQHWPRSTKSDEIILGLVAPRIAKAL